MANEDRITGFEYVGTTPLTEEQYSTQFVDFYNQFLGLPTLEAETGVEVETGEDITQLREMAPGASEGPDRSVLGPGGTIGYQDISVYDGSSTSSFSSYKEALQAAGMNDRVPFVENIVDPIMSGNIGSISFGKQAGVVAEQTAEEVKETLSIPGIKEKVAKKAPKAMAGATSMVAPGLFSMGVGGLLTGNTFVNAFGKPSFRPGGMAGMVTDVVASMQYKDMAAINVALASIDPVPTGFAMSIGNMGITRAPGSGTYTGNMQGMTHQQVKSIEAIKKGFVPSGYNMQEEKGTSLQDAGYATGQLSTGGFYKENGTYMDPFGNTSAQGLMDDLEALADKYSVSVSQASNALSKARKGQGTLTQNIAEEQDKGYASGPSPSSTQKSTFSTGMAADAAAAVSSGGDGGGNQGGASSSGAGAPSGGTHHFRQGGRVGLQAGGMAGQSGFVQRPPSQVSEGQTVADNVNTSLPEGAFVINAAAVEFVGESDIKKMLLDANKEAVRRGLTVDKQRNGAKLIDVAISQGEVVVSPHIAKIIGYDRLEKINNRGKGETQQRIQENGQQQAGRAEGGFIEPPEDLLNYEDRIIADEVKKKMSDLLNEADTFSIKVESPYFTSDADIARDQERAERIGGVPLGGAWQASPIEGKVKAPQTPTLFNLFALAEELAHASIADNVVIQEQIKLSKEDRLSDTGEYRSVEDSDEYMQFRYDEEMRAKNIAFDTVGGLLPKGKISAEYTADDYADQYLAYLYQNVEGGKLSKDMMAAIIKKDSRVSRAWNRAVKKYPQLKLNDYFK